MNWIVFATRLFLFWMILLCATSAIAQTAAPLKIERGVSSALASHRKAVLRDVRYSLQFHLPGNKSESIAAEEEISFRWKKNPQALQLDFKATDTQVRKVFVNNQQIPVHYKNEHVAISARYLKEGPNSVRILFTAGDLSLNRNPDFLYTLLVPDRARTVFPCFDQPDLKARFRLTLQIPKEWKALSNASLQDSSISGDIKTYRFSESDLFSTYLFSFVAGRFHETSQGPDGRPMRFLFRETDRSKIRLSIDSIFSWHRRSLQFLEEYTQIPFPFQKLDFAAIPDFQYGGMEHVGAIDYKASSLFLDSGATRDQENARSSLIAHETAHLWFGDLVTMQWFNDVWMKEVFANFMADKITQGAQGGGNYELKFLLTHFPRAYSIDRTAGANPIRQTLANLQEAGTLYGPVIYNKAPIMMRQLERLMGADPFREGLRRYLKQYSFGSATWPQLIKILDDLTPADLSTWNNGWVNTPGRPQLSYTLEQKSGAIYRLEIQQRGEQDAAYQLPQLMEIALVYKNRVDEITVNMNQQAVVVTEAFGKAVPDYILFNSSGQGYGVFPVDTAMFRFPTLRNPVMRVSAFINLYENMLNGKAVRPETLLKKFIGYLQEEPDELISSLLAGYIPGIYWRFVGPARRQALAPELEKQLWQMLLEEETANKKKIIFRCYQQIALTKNALENLYFIWKEQKPPVQVKLAEDDYTALALNLALKEHSDTTILSAHQKRITNPDRRLRLQFLLPALSSDVRTRDRFFSSLTDKNVRRKEAWVEEALAFLHHPLRSKYSVGYLRKSLEMLEEIQQTGDIFFPAAWLNATFGFYQSSEAAAIVRDFFQKNPSYNPRLKAKILQSADQLFRAEKLVDVQDEK